MEPIKLDKRITLLLSVMFIAIFLVGTVQAQPPFPQSGESDTGFDIHYPQYEFVEERVSFELHTHVFNRTNGYPISNSIASCYVDLYNTTGSEIFEDMLEPDGIYDHKVLIDAGNFTDRGINSFVIWCNSSNLGGFVTGVFDISQTGTELNFGNSIGYFLVVSLLVLLLIGLGMAGIFIPFKNQRSDDGSIIGINELKYVKVIAWWLAYIDLIIISFASWNITESFLAIPILETISYLIYIVLIACVTPISIVFIVVLIYNLIRDRDTAKALMRGRVRV